MFYKYFNGFKTTDKSKRPDTFNVLSDFIGGVCMELWDGEINFKQDYERGHYFKNKSHKYNCISVNVIKSNDDSKMYYELQFNDIDFAGEDLIKTQTFPTNAELETLMNKFKSRG